MAASDLPLEAYKMLANIIQSEEKLLWDRNSAFLTINAAMVTALGLIRVTEGPGAQEQAFNLGFFALCVIGALECFLWLTTIFRSEAFYNLWYEQLKYLEREHLDPVKTFQLADDYFTKGEIELAGEKLRLPRTAKIMRIYRALAVIPVAFLATWIILAFYYRP